MHNDVVIHACAALSTLHSPFPWASSDCHLTWNATKMHDQRLIVQSANQQDLLFAVKESRPDPHTISRNEADTLTRVAPGSAIRWSTSEGSTRDIEGRQVEPCGGRLVKHWSNVTRQRPFHPLRAHTVVGLDCDCTQTRQSIATSGQRREDRLPNTVSARPAPSCIGRSIPLRPLRSSYCGGSISALFHRAHS